MTPIKIILIVFLLIVLRAFLVQKSLILINRIIAILMFFFLLLLVVVPSVSTSVARFVGVGRGVDLVFYLSHLFLLFLIIGLRRQTVVLTDTVTKLSRAIALLNPHKPREKNSQTDEKTR